MCFITVTIDSFKFFIVIVCAIFNACWSLGPMAAVFMVTNLDKVRIMFSFWNIKTASAFS